MRIIQYLPFFHALGVDTAVHSLLDDKYVEDLYRERRNWRSIVRGYAGRLRALLSKGDFDLVLVEKEALPWFPHTVERALLDGRPYVVDIDDAVFHNYDASPNPLVRRTLGSKIDGLMRGSACVVAGNHYLRERARHCGAPKVQMLPTVIDLERYPKRDPVENDAPIIGWIGTPATQCYLSAIAEPLRRVCRRTRARVVLLGAASTALPDLECEIRPWTEEAEASEISRFDVGIMPLADGPWERGKCGYKLIQYMACSRPVVASAVGANETIVRHGENGFLVETPADWEAALTRLVEDSKLRREFGARGRILVEREYCVQVTAPRYAKLLQEAAAIAVRRTIDMAR